jgi:hypothetical protein
LLALTDPAAQPYPGGALHAPLQAGVDSPSSAPKYPAGHCTHAPPATRKLPRAQGSSAQAVLPGTLRYPAAQQAPAPATLKVAAAHALHAVEPFAEAKVPARQLVHAEAPTLENVPTAQGVGLMELSGQ